ncbi:MAG: class I SAM-dependent methyltransferase [Actinomycetota bacterium]|nr:class I SAM-dependent methyltransferase [Actinomycetota bacterium]
MSCRICAASTREILDLGTSPPANSLKLSSDDLQEPFPLVLEWCDTCDNVQLRDTIPADVLYRDYLYVTPVSSMLDAHYEYLLTFLMNGRYVSQDSFVVEAGSNAGNFLQHIEGRVGRILGIDPAQQICGMANDAGIPTICEFFTRDQAAKILADAGPADVVVARHCLAHNATPHEMVAAARSLLTDNGYFVIENAYVLNTIENGEFDQVYHEHMFYFSIHSMQALLRLHAMRLVNVTMSLVHGGSIIFVAAPGIEGPVSPSVERYASRERPFLNPGAFNRFAERAIEVRERLRELVVDLTRQGNRIYTYGATAKGNTLLNYVGLTNVEIPYCVDNTPIKQGRFLPMSNIEVISEEAAASDPPDYFLLTAWNYQDEIISKVRAGGNYRTQFIVPIPFVRIT